MKSRTDQEELLAFLAENGVDLTTASVADAGRFLRCEAARLRGERTKTAAQAETARLRVQITRVLSDLVATTVQGAVDGDVSAVLNRAFDQAISRLLGIIGAAAREVPPGGRSRGG